MESSIGTNGHVCATEIIVNRANLYESIFLKKIIITILIMLHFNHKIDTLYYSQTLLICKLSAP